MTAEAYAYQDFLTEVAGVEQRQREAAPVKWNFYQAYPANAVDEQRYVLIKTDTLVNAQTLAGHILGAGYRVEPDTIHFYMDFAPATEYVIFSVASLIPRRWVRTVPGNDWCYPVSARKIKLAALAALYQ